MAKQNVKTAYGIEALAKQFVQQNPGCMVSRSTMPRHIFTARELEVYGEEYLQRVVSKINVLHNGLQRNAQPSKLGQPLEIMANLMPQPSTANQTQTFLENQIASHPPFRPQPLTSTVDQSTIKMSTMKPLNSLARAAFTPQDARSDLFKVSSRDTVPFTVATSHQDYVGLIRIWVGNLPDSFTMDNLVELLQGWESSICKISEPQPPHGFSDTGKKYSSFGVRNPQDADLIIKSLDGRRLSASQRPLLVRPYQSMAQRAFREQEESSRNQGQRHQRIRSMAPLVRTQVSMETPHGPTYLTSVTGQRDTSGQKPHDQDPKEQTTPGTPPKGSKLDSTTLKSYAAGDSTREPTEAFSPSPNELPRVSEGIGHSCVTSENVRSEGLGDSHRSDHVIVDFTKRCSDHDIVQTDLEKRKEEGRGSQSVGLGMTNLSSSIDRPLETPTQHPPKVQLPQYHISGESKSLTAEPDQRFDIRPTKTAIPPKCTPKAAKSQASAAIIKQKVPIPLASMHFPSTGRVTSGTHKAAASFLARSPGEKAQKPKLEMAADDLEKAREGPVKEYFVPQKHRVESSQQSRVIATA